MLVRALNSDTSEFCYVPGVVVRLLDKVAPKKAKQTKSNPIRDTTQDKNESEFMCEMVLYNSQSVRVLTCPLFSLTFGFGRSSCFFCLLTAVQVQTEEFSHYQTRLVPCGSRLSAWSRSQEEVQEIGSQERKGSTTFDCCLCKHNFDTHAQLGKRKWQGRSAEAGGRQFGWGVWRCQPFNSRPLNLLLRLRKLYWHIDSTFQALYCVY